MSCICWYGRLAHPLSLCATIIRNVKRLLSVTELLPCLPRSVVHQRRRKKGFVCKLRPSLTRNCFCVPLRVGAGGWLCSVQHPCKQCGKPMTVHEGEKHHLCPECNHARRYPSSAVAAAPPPSSSSPPLSMFGRPSGCIDQLTEVERSAIVTLDKLGWLHRNIAEAIHCSENTVSLWVNRWCDEHSVADAERSGRPRCTTDDTDQDIMLHSDAHVNDNPKDIQREMELECSSRTIRRRLNEIDLHSCVQRAEHENVRARIACAEGYNRWTEDDWCRVMFSDETHFYLGHQGREYVQRPPGAALDPKYTRKENQQLKGKVSLWGCICAGGLGHAELYVDSLDAHRYQTISSA